MPFFSKLASASRLSVASTVHDGGGSNEKGDDELFSNMWADDDPDGDSKSLADDNASIFSFTPTLVDRRTGALAYSSDVIANAPEPLAAADLYASFVANYELWTPKAKLFSRHGLPARVKRGQNKVNREHRPDRVCSNVISSQAILTKLIKSIIVQFPLRILDEVGYHPHPQTLADIATRRQAHQRTRNTHTMGTVWAFEAIDLTGIREKELMGLVLEVLLKADDDVHNAHLIYPPESVRSAPKSLTRKDGNVVVDVKWATLRILTPQVSADRSKGKETAPPPDALQKESDEELLARLFEPTAEANQTLDRVLEHLERRGGVWTHAGHFTGHSFKNTDPRGRPEFTVHGVFPTVSWRHDVMPFCLGCSSS